MTPLLRTEVALLAAIAACATVSVFASQVGLAAVAIIHLVRTARRETRGFALPVDAAVGAFSIWTFLSAAFAPSPIAAHESGKKIVLFLLLYFAAEALRTDEARETLLDAMLFGGVALATLAVLQYAFLGYDTLNTRPRSFLGHYMTASGVIAILFVVATERLLSLSKASAIARGSLYLVGGLAGVSIAVAIALKAALVPLEMERLAILGIAVCAFVRAWRGTTWPDTSLSTVLALAFIPLGGLALLLSRTRSAWLGVVAGLAILAWQKRPKLLYVLPAAVAVLVLASPRAIVDRLTVTDASSRDRYYMWQAGLDMVIDKPIFGQGTGMILDVYPRFRWEGAPNPNAPHLHNNFVQIAAERGAPCLVFLLWLLFLLGREAWRARLTSRSGALALAAMSTTLVGGMFEYTLGDSEILMIVLLLCALPFSARERTSESAPSFEGARAAAPASGGDELVMEQ